MEVAAVYLHQPAAGLVASGISLPRTQPPPSACAPTRKHNVDMRKSNKPGD